MLIFAGLGNKGLRFAWSRHNFGFLALDHFANTLSREINKDEGSYLYQETDIEGNSLLLVKPQTYMNECGISLKQVMDDYQASISQLIILHDDIDISLGSLRIKQGGQAAGHKGLLSIIHHLQSSDFARIRLGIGPWREQTFSLTDYVLQAFTDEELPLVEKALVLCQKAIIAIISEGINKAMTEFNRRNYKFKEAEER